MKKIQLIGLVIFFSVYANAQSVKPQYTVNKSGYPGPRAYIHGRLPSGSIPKAQAMYPNHFFDSPPPAGYIQNIWFQSRWIYPYHPITWYTDSARYFQDVMYGFQVRMGYTDLPYLDTMTYFFKDLTTVFAADSLSLDTGGHWKRIPLQTPFYYDPSRNLIVELSTDTAVLFSYIDSNQIPLGFFNWTSLFSPLEHAFHLYSPTVGGSPVPNMQVINGVFVFGMDITPLSIGETDFFSSCTVYPNPARDEAVVRFQPEKPHTGVRLILTNMLGIRVAEYTYDHAGTVFQETLDLKDVAPGMYFIVLEAENGSRHMERLMVQ